MPDAHIYLNCVILRCDAAHFLLYVVQRLGRTRRLELQLLNYLQAKSVISNTLFPNTLQQYT
jgi:hypothetical protein